ncbi:hypothetical protein PVAND_014357 [Polypedilum vanderplanki]|uniref:Uncharacterized protein n=1 Tax=Polypedilum vanderplanki TaxID=319348 RepID=A0A9J6B9D2_POLVA|nr:hypothetical protein PVAND_014357 [Polypedilum vanderplanki]
MEKRVQQEPQYTKEAFAKIVGNKAEFQVRMACENFEHINKDLRGFYLKMLDEWHKSPEFNAKILGRASELFEVYYSRLRNKQQQMSKLCNSVPVENSSNSVPIDFVPNENSGPVEVVPQSQNSENDLTDYSNATLNSNSEIDDEMPNFSQEEWDGFEKESLKRSSTKLGSTSKDSGIEPVEKIIKKEN